jgi:hypothetical protein
LVDKKTFSWTGTTTTYFHYHTDGFLAHLPGVEYRLRVQEQPVGSAAAVGRAAVQVISLQNQPKTNNAAANRYTIRCVPERYDRMIDRLKSF